MTTSTRIRPVVAASAALLLALGAAPAGAVPYLPHGRDARTAQVTTLADAACFGEVTGFGHAGEQYPGTVDFGVTGGFVGISGYNGPCTVRATVQWVNLTTGRRGAVSGIARGNLPGLGENQSGFSKRVRTGTGRIQFSVTTDRPYLAQPAVSVRSY
ncbi:hypothetical protein [Gordonia sp. (in: high G+C Gram-positive bacteria)]|uniref:hypothetical protein n=1 Tax=Gordonia sp. (in: high G+C Gram-positive bacteria) TaxID=84139 RepID=UPI0039E36F95